MLVMETDDASRKSRGFENISITQSPRHRNVSSTCACNSCVRIVFCFFFPFWLLPWLSGAITTEQVDKAGDYQVWGEGVAGGGGRRKRGRRMHRGFAFPSLVDTVFWDVTAQAKHAEEGEEQQQ